MQYKHKEFIEKLDNMHEKEIESDLKDLEGLMEYVKELEEKLMKKTKAEEKLNNKYFAFKTLSEKELKDKYFKEDIGYSEFVEENKKRGRKQIKDIRQHNEDTQNQRLLSIEKKQKEEMDKWRLSKKRKYEEQTKERVLATKHDADSNWSFSGVFS